MFAGGYLARSERTNPGRPPTLAKTDRVAPGTGRKVAAALHDSAFASVLPGCPVEDFTRTDSEPGATSENPLNSRGENE
jgi:hypothetical protein